MPRLKNLTVLAIAAILMSVTAPATTIAGGVDLPTTCSAQADDTVDEGLTLLHNMMYIQAEAAFNRAAESDPNCAMAQWGIAMSNFHPLWPGEPSDGETTRGSTAAKRLEAMEPGSDLENALAAAASAFYSPGHSGYGERLAAWAAAQIASHDKNPDNIDAAALAALARMATTPRDPERVATFAAIGDVLDGLHKKAPDHTGVIHYAIHAYDNPALKQRGIPYAQIYDKVSPSAPHALHMPAHIFTRVGRWEESINLNRRSAEAAIEQSGDVLQSHYVHAVDYMVYALIQMGKTEQAEMLVDEMLAKRNHQVTFGGAFALAASPMRLVLEQDQWTEAAALSPVLHPDIPWQKFPQAVAMLWFTKGLGAARAGDVENALKAIDELKSLLETMQKGGAKYWSELTKGHILTVEAWIELAKGNSDLAVTLQTKAADLEDQIGKSPVTPGHVLPARELLGDVYRQLSRSDEAATAYRASLALYPNRARSLAALN